MCASRPSSLRFGQITDVQTEPGLYFKLPTSLVDTVQIIENRLLRYDIANMQLQVNDGATYVVDAFLTYRIADPRKFRERAQGDLDLAEQRIATRFDAALRQVYGQRDFNAALSAERPAMMREARDLIRPDMAELGIDVIDVRILRTDLTAGRFASRPSTACRPNVWPQAAAHPRRRPAGGAVAQGHRRPPGGRDRRGGQQGQRNPARRGRCRSAARSSRRPMARTRSSSSSTARCNRTGRRSGRSGTTMVLSPDSEFFQYFKADTLNGTIPTPAAPNGIAAAAVDRGRRRPTPSDTLPPTNVGAPADATSTPGARPVTPRSGRSRRRRLRRAGHRHGAGGGQSGRHDRGAERAAAPSSSAAQ